MAGHIVSGGNLNWNTPRWITEALPAVFGGPPDLDPCSNEASVVGATVGYTLPESDGLIDPWAIRGPGTTVFLNPPFGRTYMTEDRSSAIGQKGFEVLSEEEQELYTTRSVLADWIKKAVVEHLEHGVEVVSILPAATDTAHWQKLIFPSASRILFIKGRVRFLGPDGKPAKAAAPMATALLYWGTNPQAFEKAFVGRGVCR